jgi:hypothetical protein
MLGTGMFLGPAWGALSLFLLPSVSNAGVYSVSGLLLAGFSGLLYMGRFRFLKSQRDEKNNP